MVKPASSNSAPTAGDRLQQIFQSKYLYVALLAILAPILFVLFLAGGDVETQVDGETTTKAPHPLTQALTSFGKKNTILPTKSGCPKECERISAERREAWGGDLTSTEDLVRLVTTAHDGYVNSLKNEYGEKYYNLLFTEEAKVVVDNRTVTENVARARSLFVPPAKLSKPRIVRRLMMKLLSMQIAILDEESKVEGCDCTEVTGRRLEENRTGNGDSTEMNGEDSRKRHYTKLIWATGGHSAAAGHGNFHNESYTAVMERTARDVFSAVGIEFVGRNYAMGGTASSPEIALCMEEIFGTDIDFISWDYGMIEGRSNWGTEFYANRAAVHQNRPILFVFGTNPGKIAVLAGLEKAGLGTFYLAGEWSSNLPDMKKVSEAEVKDIPYKLKDMLCDGKLEGNDPCGGKKYTMTACPQRKGRVGWHPGWKHHSLQGQMMASFLVEMLLDAAHELNNLLSQSNSETGFHPDDPRSVLSYLKSKDDADLVQFRNSVPKEDAGGVDKDVASQLLRSPSICHTAILPAQSRYLGYVTESNKIGEEIEGTYDNGISRTQIQKQQVKHNVFPLVYDDGYRRPWICPVLLRIDWKDYFFIRQSDGWINATLPNKAEVNAYDVVTEGSTPKREGIVVLCGTVCDWGKCPKEDLKLETVNDGNITIEVDGQIVKEVKTWGRCVVLYGGEGARFGPGKGGDGKGGQYDLKIKVNVAGKYTRIGTIVIL